MEQNFQTFANLIKNNHSRNANRLAQKPRVIKNQIISAREEAQNIIQNAEQNAERILHKTLTEAEAVKENAYREAIENALTEFENNLLESKEIREHVLRESEKDLLRLSVRLAEKIIGREIEKDDKAIIEIVSTALQNARQQQKITVRVNPKDLPLVEKETERFSSVSRSRFIDFIADPRVATTGCLIESEVGSIDARLETQLKVLERALLSQSEGETAQE